MTGEAPSYLTTDDVTSVKATELRTQMRNILERAKFQGERFVVCTHGQQMAVLIGVAEYLQLETAAERGNLPPPL